MAWGLCAQRRRSEARYAAAERQGGAVAPDRRRGVLPAAGGVMIDGTQLFNDKLAQWERFYNYHRPHAGLGGRT
jgi:transposase InsO family protein